MKKNIYIFIFLLFAGCGKEYIPPGNNLLCGPQSLLFICQYYGIPSTIDDICSISGYKKDTGTNIFGLFQASEKLGLMPQAVKISMDDLKDLKNPCIAYVNRNHFLVVRDFNGRFLDVFDPPEMTSRVSVGSFKKMWQGEAIIFTETKEKVYFSSKKNIKPSGPYISFKTKIHNFGVVKQGDILTHDFTFLNEGSDTLKILSLRTRCICTEALKGKTVIPPGDSSFIQVEFKTEGKPRGHTSQTAVVMTNDKKNEYVSLLIEATILSEIQIVPEKIELGEIQTNTTVKRKLLLLDDGADILKVSKMEASYGIKTMLGFAREDTTGKFEIPIEVSIFSGNKIGEQKKYIKVFTNDKNRPEFDIPVEYTVVTDAKAFPPRLFWDSLKKNTNNLKSIELTVGKSGIGKIYKTSECIDYQINKTGKEGKYNLSITLKTPDKATAIRDTLKIYGKDTPEPVLEIPIYAKVT